MRKELTPSEVSKILGVGRLYVYELLAASRIKARKVLGRWLIPRSEVNSYRRNRSRYRGRQLRTVGNEIKRPGRSLC
jgi:excisionase family DNA binding protein